MTQITRLTDIESKLMLTKGEKGWAEGSLRLAGTNYYV